MIILVSVVTGSLQDFNPEESGFLLRFNKIQRILLKMNNNFDAT